MSILPRTVRSIAILLLTVPLSAAGLRGQVVPDPVADGNFRVATWNIRFFPQAATDENRVAEMIADLDADVLAVQEITDSSELQDLLDAVNAESARRALIYGTRARSYDFELTNSGGGGGQFVGLIFDTNAVQLSNVASLTSLRMSSGLRPALFARVTSLRGGLDFQIIANHTDSGTNLSDFTNRQDFLTALATELDDRFDDEADFVVIGDLVARFWYHHQYHFEPTKQSVCPAPQLASTR